MTNKLFIIGFDTDYWSKHTSELRNTYKNLVIEEYTLWLLFIIVQIAQYRWLHLKPMFDLKDGYWNIKDLDTHDCISILCSKVGTIYIFIIIIVLDLFIIDLDSDDCTPNLCLNGGTCVDGLQSFTCLCPSGFYGNLCESSKSYIWNHFAGRYVFLWS